MQGQSINNKKQLELEKKKAELRKRIDRVRDIEQRQSMFELATKERIKKRIKHEKVKSEDNDDEFLIDDYESDEEKNSTKKVDTKSNLSREVQDLLAK